MGRTGCVPPGGKEGAETRRKFPKRFQGKNLLLRNKCLKGRAAPGLALPRVGGREREVAVPILGSPKAGDGVHGAGGPARNVAGRGRERGTRAGGQQGGSASTPPSLADPKESQRPQAHECLGEALRVLRQVINKYPLLNTLETLTAAGTLISKVKGEPRGLRAPAPSLLPWVGMGGPGEPIWGLPHGWGEGIDSRDPAPHPPACPTVGSAPAPCPPPRAGLPGVGVCVLRAVQCQK